MTPDHVAWLRFKTANNGATTIHLCDSDSEGAFPVYRHPSPATDVVSWAQAVLTALNVGDIKSGSPLHLKLREVMVDYRNKTNG